MQRKKILLVDDSDTTIVVQTELLLPYYEVVVANDGPSGIAKAFTERPDLIVLDVVLPTMTGLKVCQVLRATDATRWTPILMITGVDEKENIPRSRRLGASAYLAKPFDGQEFLSIVRRLLGELEPEFTAKARSTRPPPADFDL